MNKKQQIIEILKANPQATTNEIISKVGCGIGGVSRARRSMGIIVDKHYIGKDVKAIFQASSKIADSEVMDRTGCSQRTCYKIRKELGITRERTLIVTDENIKKALALRVQGLVLDQIAEVFSCSRNTARVLVGSQKKSTHETKEKKHSMNILQMKWA